VLATEDSVHLFGNGITHNMYERGSGTQHQLLLLHYFGGSGRSWDAVIDGLMERNDLAYRLHCFAPDLRGFGATEAPPSGYTLDDYADDILALVASLGLDNYWLVGHSMGGKIALNVATRRPAGLNGLLLVAPSPPTAEPIEAAERARLLQRHGERAAAEETLHKITVQPLAPMQRDQAIADNLRSAAPAWRAWLEYGSRENISERLARLPDEADIKIMVGARDPVIAPQLVEHELVQRLIQAGRPAPVVEVVPEVGHLLPLEAPHAIVEMLAQIFLKRSQP